MLRVLYSLGRVAAYPTVVLPGELYRSPQLRPRRFDPAVQEFGFRSVVSVRGGNPTRPWYARQQIICLERDAVFHSVRLRATTLPSPVQLNLLTRIFDSTPRPMLIHCRGGADRTGLAAAIFLHLHSGLTLGEARTETLNWRYRHVPSLAPGVAQFFDLFKRSEQTCLRTWLENDYLEIFRRLRDEQRPPARSADEGVAAG